jgi:GT2 family glycosyltransferase
MSFTREALMDAGGFDGRLGGSAHLEETDLAVRVRKSGGRIVFEPKASLVHLLEPDGGCRPKNLREWFLWYGHNFSLFYLKNYPKPLFPVYALYYLLKLPFSAVKNGSIGVVPWGVAGFFRGIRTFMAG